MAYAGRANILMRKGEYKQALIDAETSTMIEPNYPFGYYISGQIKGVLNKEGACDDLYKAKKLGQGGVDEVITHYCK